MDVITVIFVISLVGSLFSLGFYCGRRYVNNWDESREKFCYLSGWQDGFYYAYGEKDLTIYTQIRNNALSNFNEWKGYPHNSRH